MPCISRIDRLLHLCRFEGPHQPYRFRCRNRRTGLVGGTACTTVFTQVYYRLEIVLSQKVLHLSETSCSQMPDLDLYIDTRLFALNIEVCDQADIRSLADFRAGQNSS